MEDDLDQILATKKNWKTRQGTDRRIKDGTPEDRKTTADVLRRGRQLKVDSLRPSFIMMLWRLFFPIVIATWIQGPAEAHRPYTDDQAIKAIIGEAENQGEQGMIYVACGIINRGTLKGVYGLKAPRVKHHQYSAKVLLEAQTAWDLVNEIDGWEYCQDLRGAKDWENTNAFGVPYWAKTMKVVFIYKDHKFFR